MRAIISIIAIVQIRTDGNLSLPDFKGNSGLILTAVRLDWLIELELQNRFWLDFRFGFRILTADEGIAESSQ